MRYIQRFNIVIAIVECMLVFDVAEQIIPNDNIRDLCTVFIVSIIVYVWFQYVIINAYNLTG